MDDNNKSTNGKKNKKNGNNSTTGKFKFNFYWIYAILFAIFLIMQFYPSWESPKDITWGKLRQLVVEGKVEKIVIVNKESAEIYLKDTVAPAKGAKPGKIKTPDFVMNVGSLEAFEKNINDAQQNIPENARLYPSYETRKNWGGELLGYLLPLIILIALWFFLMRMMNKGSRAARFSI